MAVEPLNTVGHDIPRVDAYERVTGRATYTRDIKLPGMLYARLLRSDVPHARIRSIDTSKAEALPGVRAVITHETHQLIYGSGSISGGRQYNDSVKDITKRLRFQRLFRIKHKRKLFIVDLNKLNGLLCHMSVDRRNCRYRLTDEAHWVRKHMS